MKDSKFSTSSAKPVENPIGLYIHTPFCIKKCPYCDFYSLTGDQALYHRYKEAVVRAIASTPYKSLAVDSIYFGGGTPSLLGAEHLLDMLHAAKQQFSVAENCEVTLEANPSSTDLPLLRALVKGGFNRVSFGLQSTKADTLATLGRLHSYREGAEAVTLAKEAGFPHISADIMLGVPGQTAADCADAAAEIAALPVDHISAYLLKLEPGTPFYTRYTEQDDDLLCDCYEAFAGRLADLGYSQYEISNFSKDGCESRHNTKYWTLAPYLGIGPSAHSFMEGKRFYFPRDLEGFLNTHNPWEAVVQDGAGGDFAEAVMLGLRLSRGINLCELREQYQRDIAPLLAAAKPLVKAGLLILSEDRIALTPQGMLLSNSIITKLLGSY